MSIWGRVRAKAEELYGRAEELYGQSHGDAATLDELVGRIVAVHGERLERVLTACSFLVDGTTTRDRALVLSPGAVVDILPPFAGG